MRLYAILGMGFAQYRPATPRNSHLPLLHHHHPVILIITTATSHPIIALQPRRQSREGLLRFLRADKYDLQLCIDRIEKCLIWRRKEGMDDLEGLAKRVEGEVSLGSVQSTTLLFPVL